MVTSVMQLAVKMRISFHIHIAVLKIDLDMFWKIRVFLGSLTDA
jgi:hypothetical protein